MCESGSYKGSKSKSKIKMAKKFKQSIIKGAKNAVKMGKGSKPKRILRRIVKK